MAERRPSETLPTGPVEKDGTFVMTETASTAFPMGDPGSPPTTAGDALGIVGDISSLQGVSDGGSATERHSRLLVEAEMRAEHQAQARATMLNLAAALDESNARRHELASQLSQEYRTSAALRKQVDAYQSRLEELEVAEEKRQAEVLIQKALATGNTMFFGMLMEKSREAYPTALFGEGQGPATEPVSGAGDKEREAEGGPRPKKKRSGRSRREAQEAEADGATGAGGAAAGGVGAEGSGAEGAGTGATSADGKEGEEGPRAGGVQFGSHTEEEFDDSSEYEDDSDDELLDEPAPRSEAAANARRASSWDFMVNQGAAADKVTFGWTLRLWRHEVVKLRAARADELAEEAKRKAEEERKRQIEEEKRKAVEAIKKIAQALEEALNAAKETIRQHEKRQQDLEKELEALRGEMAEREAKHKEEVQGLQENIDGLRQERANLKGQLSDLQKEYDGALESLRKADQQFANERRQLQDTIRNITSELQEAMVLAKHMRETALKAKREAAGSVSPSKFAELIGQLEEMKSQLSALWKDCMKGTETNEWLRRQLDKNQRQLELERQFLPLLHKVRGPVGPKVAGGIAGDGPNKRKDAAANSQAIAMPPLAGQMSPNKLRTSQSAGALGGPLGGPGGGRQSAGQQDVNRFSSRDFASSNGFSVQGSFLA